MPYMTRIPSDLARWGLPTHVVDGAGSRGSSSFAPRTVGDHWTATPYKPGRVLPTRNVLINGHGDLPGPLCNVALAFDGGCHVVAMGRANHAGKGGWRGATGNSAAYGIEAEGTGAWTPEQRYVYPILVAALLDGLDRDERETWGHSEWATPKGRKVDINGWPGGGGGMGGFRRTVGALLAAGRGASPLNHYPSLAAAIKAQGLDPKPVTTPIQQEDDDMTPDQAAALARIDAAAKTLLADVGTTKAAAGRIETIVASIQRVVGATRDRFEVLMAAAARIDVNAGRGAVAASDAATLAQDIVSQVDELPAEVAAATRDELAKRLGAQA